MPSSSNRWVIGLRLLHRDFLNLLVCERSFVGSSISRHRNPFAKLFYSTNRFCLHLFAVSYSEALEHPNGKDTRFNWLTETELCPFRLVLMGSTIRTVRKSHELDSSPLQCGIKMSDIIPTPPQVAKSEPSESAEKTTTSSKRLSAALQEKENVLPFACCTEALCPSPRPALLRPRGRQQVSEKRASYYGEIFDYQPPQDVAKDRVRRDSVVVAEIQLNCKVSRLCGL